ncbi:TPA: type VI secretion system-associated FHA domain protein TagH [Enterobacter ludwigii]|uniref:type VI secretion system-associated FHA domain protein TagH n=1 Tax=Enterobacter ludwigii TaxID=299767 RepID=UPI0032F701A3|nr:type VI secretion system-associated FHA domain protein TagH [Enterobacter ludwigii]HDR2596134.1 type VI secretion system-associated FHA domain protein TagH [Enterobacter ludwigii]
MSNGAQQQLSLLVLNSAQLEGDSQVQHHFGPEGGTLGASDGDSWQLRESLGAVLPGHARIALVDGHFCLHDQSGQTFINGAGSPIGGDRHVRLHEGDELTIGPFRIRVSLGPLQQPQALDELIDNRPQGGMDDWLSGPVHDAGAAHPAPVTSRHDDPLGALRQDNHSVSVLVSGMATTPAALQQTEELSSGKETMNQTFIELPGVRSTALSHDEGMIAALETVMTGLGSNLTVTDPALAAEMLSDMGRTLRALVEGLLALQAEQGALADKLLRPIEDNPLRLGMNYHDTVSLLFAEGQSPVHLSAPAAVAEILSNIRLQHAANQKATSVALQSVLQAFSPEGLLARFAHYRRSGPGENPGWEWEMYQHYFSELTSSRQQGVEKLFRQVYAQAYDRAVRDGLESL